MSNKIYIFQDSLEEQNQREAKKCSAMFLSKVSALKELIDFTINGCKGFNPQISEKTIDDGFDCITEYYKTILHATNYSEDERERAIHNLELNRKIQKNIFKSFLKVK